MGIRKTLGGERLGSGNKMAVELDNFGRSSHNIGCVIRTDQAFGTIVPYFCDVATNGTTYYIDIATKVRTLPTNGPIFGSAKHQIDVFSTPLRLYIAALHNNALGVGLKMQNIKMPIMSLRVPFTTLTQDVNRQQIAQDSLLAYLGIRGLGRNTSATENTVRNFPAFFLLNYWDIYKNYYANKQEEIGYVIGQGEAQGWYMVKAHSIQGQEATVLAGQEYPDGFNIEMGVGSYLDVYGEFNPNAVFINNAGTFKLITKEEFEFEEGRKFWRYTVKKPGVWQTDEGTVPIKTYSEDIALNEFELANIDKMRENILAAPNTAPYKIPADLAPYSASVANALTPQGKNGNASVFSQAGLGVRTYLSDRFNNWLSTEWIDGVNGINEIASVDVSDGKLTMDALILAKKVFEMLNRIAISGGSYNDWQEAVYGVKTIRMAESPMYQGGMSSEIVFDEVVSNAATETEPLGTLAGRGADRGTKGGRSIKVKVKEPSMLMILGSIVPRIDYSQGNAWWNEIMTMNDLHKPNLDKIGFQELPVEEFAAFDTAVQGNSILIKHSQGKQPAWIQYMTNVNKTYGDFAANGPLDFMAFNRIYEPNPTAPGDGLVSNASTYIDPTMYNRAFADAKLSAKNIWVQVAFDITARRIMSAKQIPNL